MRRCGLVWLRGWSLKVGCSDHARGGQMSSFACAARAMAGLAARPAAPGLAPGNGPTGGWNAAAPALAWDAGRISDLASKRLSGTRNPTPRSAPAPRRRRRASIAVARPRRADQSRGRPRRAARVRRPAAGRSRPPPRATPTARLRRSSGQRDFPNRLRRLRNSPGQARRRARLATVFQGHDQFAHRRETLVGAFSDHALEGGLQRFGNVVAQARSEGIGASRCARKRAWIVSPS